MLVGLWSPKGRTGARGFTPLGLSCKVWAGDLSSFPHWPPIGFLSVPTTWRLFSSELETQERTRWEQQWLTWPNLRVHTPLHFLYSIGQVIQP